MSSYQVSDNHLNVLVHALFEFVDGAAVVYDPDGKARYYEETDRDSRSQVGQILRNENTWALSDRYGDDTLIAYGYRRPATEYSPVQILKACDCYEYQAGASRTWDGSEARQILTQIRKGATQRLEGYDEADWEIE